MYQIQFVGENDFNYGWVIACDMRQLSNVLTILKKSNCKRIHIWSMGIEIDQETLQPIASN